jgi:hypothetical protein
MLDYFTPEDKVLDGNDHHKHVRALIEQQYNAPDDSDFTIDEIMKAIEGIEKRKHQAIWHNRRNIQTYI